MIFEPIPLVDCYLIKPQLITDERGFFYEKFNKKHFEMQTKHSGNFVQDNVSSSVYGVLRGLHLQKGEYAQAKLVSCLHGEVWDVVVDLRQNSPSFGKWFGVVLSAENHWQLFVPRGFAHGFSVLSAEATIFYKCDNYYNAQAEGGIIFNDEDLQIDWKIPLQDVILSEKDRAQKFFRERNF